MKKHPFTKKEVELLHDVIDYYDTAMHNDDIEDDPKILGQLGIIIRKLGGQAYFDGITYKCPECNYKIEWTAEDYANKGEPVCPYDDSDMEKI